MMVVKTSSNSEVLAMLRTQRRRLDAVAARFVDAVLAGDAGQVGAAIAGLDDDPYAWRAAFRAVSRQTAVPDKSRRDFLARWLQYGDSIRDAVSDDRALIVGLRALLPRYDGPDVLLWRGDSLFNRRRRTYGLSWSVDKNTADGFARGVWQTFVGGSVVLEAQVPAAAIICAPYLIDDSMGEAEYLVDRRRLGLVRVVGRYPQVSAEEQRAVAGLDALA